jgi:hypothetical protein
MAAFTLLTSEYCGNGFLLQCRRQAVALFKCCCPVCSGCATATVNNPIGSRKLAVVSGRRDYLPRQDGNQMDKLTSKPASSAASMGGKLRHGSCRIFHDSKAGALVRKQGAVQLDDPWQLRSTKRVS